MASHDLVDSASPFDLYENFVLERKYGLKDSPAIIF